MGSFLYMDSCRYICMSWFGLGWPLKPGQCIIIKSRLAAVVMWQISIITSTNSFFISWDCSISHIWCAAMSLIVSERTGLYLSRGRYADLHQLKIWASVCMWLVAVHSHKHGEPSFLALFVPVPQVPEKSTSGFTDHRATQQRFFFSLGALKIYWTKFSSPYPFLEINLHKEVIFFVFVI